MFACSISSHFFSQRETLNRQWEALKKACQCRRTGVQACKKQTQKEMRMTRARYQCFGQRKSASGERSKTGSKTFFQTSFQVQRSERIPVAKREEKEIENWGGKRKQKMISKTVWGILLEESLQTFWQGIQRDYRPNIFWRICCFVSPNGVSRWEQSFFPKKEGNLFWQQKRVSSRKDGKCYYLWRHRFL